MPVDLYLKEVLRSLERRDHPGGELLLRRDYTRRWAERDGRYDATFAALNPTGSSIRL